MTLTEKVLKAHDRQIKLSYRLAKVGYDSALGKVLRLQAYYRDGFILLKQWREFLYIRKRHLGDRYFAVDQAIMHTEHAAVKQLMQVEPQVRGNDLGIIRILAPSFLLNNPLSLGMNGPEHTGARAVFEQALGQPGQHATTIAQLIHQFLAQATQQNQLHIGNDLPRLMVWLLHQLVFQLNLSESEITASRAYISGLPLASLPNFISKYLLSFKTAPHIRHRTQLTAKYRQSPQWAAYLATGEQYHLNAHQVANSLFDMIHIAGTAGTSALLGSVVGVLCQQQDLREAVMAEVEAIWPENDAIAGDKLAQATRLHDIILETARLYPPVRFVSQLAQTSGEIQIGASKCPFQKGTRLLGSIFTANRDGQRYQQPDEFDPTRDYSDLLSWNGDRHERACPGRELSIEVIKIFCLHLLKHYQWSSITEVKWDFEKVTAVTPNNLILQGFQPK